MSGTDIAFAEIDGPESHAFLKSVLRETGGIVLRNAIAPERCRFYRDLISKTHIYLAEQCAKEGHPVEAATVDDWNDMGWRRLAFELREGQLPPGMFERANPGFSIFDLIGDFQFNRVMTQFFIGEFRKSPSAHTRRVSSNPDLHSKHWQKPTLWHLDAQYHNPRHFGLNFWVPLDACGINAPGLQIIEGNVFDVQRFVEYDPVAETFNAQKLKAINEKTFDHFDTERIYAPELNVGDVFVLHNWTIHQSCSRAGMTGVRQSCELRVIQNAWTFPDGASDAAALEGETVVGS